jgi:hypothetical protein
MADVAQWRQQAAAAATAASLPLSLVMAVIETESSGRPHAWKPEPPYRYLWDVRLKKPFRKLTPAEIKSELAPDDFPAWPGEDQEKEWWGQQASWGLMQVMGGVAREMGFVGDMHPEMCTRPEEGLLRGCKYLALCVRRWGSIERGVSAYNAGSPRLAAGGGFENQAYVDKVLGAQLRWAGVLGAQGGRT